MRWSAIVAVLLVTMSSPGLAQAQDHASEGGAPRLPVVGTLHRFPSDLETVLGAAPRKTPAGVKVAGWPYLDVKNRRIFQLYERDPSGIAIVIRSLDTFAPEKVIEIPKVRDLTGGTFVTPADASVEIDEEGKRLFLWTRRWDGQDGPGVVVVDWASATSRLDFTEIPFPDGASTVPTVGQSVPIFTGMTYEPSERKLYVRTDTDTTSTSDGANRSNVAQIDAGGADRVAISVDWSRMIRACRGAIGFGQERAGDMPVLWMAEERSLYVPCNSKGAIVVRIPVSEAGVPITEEVFRGVGTAMNHIIDRVGRRIHMKTSSAGVGLAVLTFDAVKKAFVGQTPLQNVEIGKQGAVMSNPLGVDETTGRVYALSDHARYGLTMLEGRMSPVPPGKLFPQVRHRAGKFPPPFIRFDPKTRRIFVPRWKDDQETGDFLILKDEAPPPVAPTIDVDTLTQDIEENEGVTTFADFSGGASAYGLRVLIPGGVRGVITARDSSLGDPLRSACRSTDRELLLGRIERTFLSTAGRTASSIAGETDLTTKSDIKEPSRCEETRPAEELSSVLGDANAKALYNALADPIYQGADDHVGSRLGWPFRWTECPVPDPDGGAGTVYADNATGDAPFTASSSSVDCLPNKAQLVSHSAARLAPPGTPLTVGEAGSSTEVVRDSKRGLISRAIAYVRDVSIGGVVQIDGVYAIAESFATGRPKGSNKIGAGTRYIRGVTGFTSPGFSCGHEDEDPCGDPSALVDGVNRALSGAGEETELYFPPIDSALAGGSPGGYQSGVQRDFFDSLNAEFSNGDILREVPAMEIVRTNDTKNFGRQRQIVQFAAVLANSQYGISSLGEGFEIPPTSGGSTDPVPPAEQALGEAVDSLAPTAGVPSVGTGLSSAPSVLPPLAASPPLAGSAPGLARRFTEGLSFLMRNPKTAGLMVGAWILLLLPGALAYRRRLLMNAVTSTGRGTS